MVHAHQQLTELSHYHTVIRKTKNTKPEHSSKLQIYHGPTNRQKKKRKQQQYTIKKIEWEKKTEIQDLVRLDITTPSNSRYYYLYAPFRVTAKQTDIIIPSPRARKHHTVRMKREAIYWRASVLSQKCRMRLHRG